MWKNNKENVKRHISDTITHKGLFIQSCSKMLDYLYECDRYEDALELARRCLVHDNSKLENDELEQFIQLPLEDQDRKGTKQPLTDKQRKLIELHWSRNRHHPEYFTNPNEMSEIDILEMICDWYARNMQFGLSNNESDFINYVMNVQQARFEFGEPLFEKILCYCKILCS